MVIKLKKGDSYIEVDTEINEDEVDTVVKKDVLIDELDKDIITLKKESDDDE